MRGPSCRSSGNTRTSGSALDVFHAYEALGEVQLDSLNKFIAAFDALNASLSENQRKTAEAVFREGPLNTMLGGVPMMPISPLSYEYIVPYYVPQLRVRSDHVFAHRFGHFEHFRGIASPGRAALTGAAIGAFHR
jgi:hypothetical protein